MIKVLAKDSVVRFFTVVIAVSCIASLVAALKFISLPSLGFVIDDNFLKTLVERENCIIMLKSSAAILITFALGLLAYCLIKYKFSKSPKENTKRNLVLGSMTFPIIGIVAFVGLVLDLSTRLYEEPKVKKEIVADKFETRGAKSGVHYHLMFNGGSTLTVDSKEYRASSIRQEFYTVYQDNLLIQVFPANRYVLKSEQ